jgi:protein gp37
MGENSAISWTDATFNPFIGCTKVSAACDHCYAARDNERRKWVDGWGAGVPRRRTSVDYWKQPIRWNKTALAKYGRPMRVFCASLADVFDNEVDPAWRDDLWRLVRYTPNLRWILLTKRIGNARKMLPFDWGHGYDNVGLMATLENQDVWDRDYGKLMDIPARWRGVSAEPLLGPIDMSSKMASHGQIDWMITGGESGPAHRPLDVDAVRLIRDQCSFYGVAFHHKQNGGITGKAAGCLVDGVEYKNFPPALAA